MAFYTFSLTTKKCYCQVCRKFVYHDWSEDAKYPDNFKTIETYTFDNAFLAWSRYQSMKLWMFFIGRTRHHGGDDPLTGYDTHVLSELIMETKAFVEPTTYRG